MTKNTKIVVKLLTIVAIIAIISCLVLVGCDKIEDLKDLGKTGTAEQGSSSNSVQQGDASGQQGNASGDSQGATATVEPKAVLVIVGQGNDYKMIVAKTNAEYMSGLLLELAEQQKVTYQHSESQYGTYVEALGNIQPASSNEWVAVYHDIDDVTLRGDLGSWPMENAEYGHITFFSSSVGVDLLPIIDGHIYYFTLGTM